MKRPSIAILTAFALWTLMFSPWTAPYLPFWVVMTCSAVVLIVLSLIFGGKPKIAFNWQDILLGVVIAAALWGIFWIGDKVSQWMFPSFARGQVNLIYGMKDGWNPWLLSILLLTVIGPAEELFWRGYVQRTLTERAGGKIKKEIAATVTAIAIYTLVHIFSLNFMLIMAALVCGIVWGGLYYLMPKRFGAIVISHALWDAAVFIWFPI